MKPSSCTDQQLQLESNHFNFVKQNLKLGCQKNDTYSITALLTNVAPMKQRLGEKVVKLKWQPRIDRLMANFNKDNSIEFVLVPSEAEMRQHKST